MKKGFDYTAITIAFCCHDGNGNILMSKRSKNCRDEHGRWDLGAGSLEFGDGVIDTLKREIKEEYCAEVLDYEFLGYSELHRKMDNKNTHWIALNFKVLIDKKEANNGEPHKFDDVKWFPINKLPKPLHSHAPIFIQKYKDKILNK